MLRKETEVVISDNSGGLVGKIFQLYGRGPKSASSVGEIVRVAIKKAQPNMQVKKGQHYLAIIVRTKYGMSGQGKFAFSGDNAVVLLNNKKEPIGTRVYGNVSEILGQKGFQNVLSMASGVF